MQDLAYINYNSKVAVKIDFLGQILSLLLTTLPERNIKVGTTKRKLNQEGKHKIKGGMACKESDKYILNLNYIQQIKKIIII